MATNPQDIRATGQNNPSNPPRMDEQIDNEGWEGFIETLLNGLNVDYELEITQDKINIKANSKDTKIIQERLERAFKSPDIFIQYFPLKVVDSSGAVKKLSAPVAPAAEVIPDAPALEDSVKEGVRRFKRLFGNIESIGGVSLNVDDLFNEQEGALSENGVLYSKPVQGMRKAKAWKPFLETLLPRFLNVSPSDLRKIWLDDTMHLPEAPDTEEDDALAGPVQRFFRIETKGGKARLVFDYAALQRHVFPPSLPFPILPKNDASTDQAVISIPRPLLFEKTKEIVSKITEGEEASFLLRVYKKDGKLKANTVFFTVAKGPKKTQRIHFVVDCSSSMASLIDKLKNDILEMIKQLRALDSTMEVQITLFASNTLPSKVFKITEVLEIERFVLQSYSGGTRLYGTIEDTVKNIKEKAVLETNVDNTVLAFTDGADDHGILGFEAFKQRILQLNAGDNIKKFFPIGIGHGHDAPTMQLMGALFNTPYIYQQNPGDFNQIYDYARQIRHSEKVFKMTMRGETSGTEKQLKIPLTLDGDPKEVTTEFPFEEHETVVVEMNGKSYSFRVDDASRVPEASVRDLTNEILKTARMVVSGQGTAAKKAETLKQAVAQISDLGSQLKLTKTHQKIIKRAQEKIKHFMDRLIEATSKNDEAIHESLKTAAKDELGFTEETVQNVAIDATPSTPPIASTGFLSLGAAAAELTAPLFATEYEVLDGVTDGLETFDKPHHAAITAPTTTTTERKTAADIPGTQQKMKAAAEKPAESATAKESLTTAQAPAKPKMHKFVPTSMNHVADNPTPVLMHVSTEGQTLVFSNTAVNARALPTPAVAVAPVNSAPSNSNASASQTNAASNPTNGIGIIQSSCRPVQFNGKPSVYCEGHSKDMGAVDVVHTPTPAEPPIPIQDGNIMLGAVVAHWGKSLWNYGKSFFNGTSTKEETTTCLTQKGFGIKLKMLNDRLQEISESLKGLPSSKVAELSEALADSRYALSEIRSNGYQDPSARELLRDLTESAASLLEQAKAAKIDAMASKKLSAAAARAAARIKPNAKSAQLSGPKPDQCPIALSGSAAAPLMLSQFQTNHAALVGANAMQTRPSVQMVAAPAPVRALKG